MLYHISHVTFVQNLSSKPMNKAKPVLLLQRSNRVILITEEA